jgi:shikimate kinase
MAPTVVLVGAPGSGKSTIGELIAEKLSVDFTDTDQAVEERAKKTISQIFIDDGEAAFRLLEKEEVAKAIANSSGVVSLGGGAVLNPETRALLKTVPTLWLEVSQKTAAARVGLAQARPVLVGNVRATLVKLLEERTPLYQEVATFSIDTSDKSTIEVLDLALEWLSNE